MTKKVSVTIVKDGYIVEFEKRVTAGTSGKRGQLWKVVTETNVASAGKLEEIIREIIVESK